MYTQDVYIHTHPQLHTTLFSLTRLLVMTMTCLCNNLQFTATYSQGLEYIGKRI